MTTLLDTRCQFDKKRSMETFMVSNLKNMMHSKSTISKLKITDSAC